MLNNLKGVISDESGQVLPMFVIMLVVLLGVSAIVIDGGRVYHLKNEVYNIAEASALSAKDFLRSGSNDDIVKSVVMEYAKDNGAKDEEVFIETYFGEIDADGNIVNKVTVKVSKEYNMLFGNLISDSDGWITEKYTIEVIQDVEEHLSNQHPIEQVSKLNVLN